LNIANWLGQYAIIVDHFVEQGAYMNDYKSFDDNIDREDICTSAGQSKKHLTISIALCTYNGERFLNDQLDSYCRQTRLPDELIICDDASQDSTVQLIQEFAQKAPFTVRLFINEKNMGWRKNFDQALSLCSGDIIALSDQDNIWLDNRLARFEQIFLNYPNVMYAFSDALMVNDKSQDLGYTILGKFYKFYKKLQYSPFEFTKILIRRHKDVPGCLMVMKKDLANTALPLPDLWDHDTWLSIVGSTMGSVIKIPDVLMKYRLHAGNTCPPKYVLKPTFASRQSFARYAKFCQNALVRINEKDNYLKYRKELRKIYEGKVKHAMARSSMPKNILRRLYMVTKETVSCRYFRHSSGIKSIARDLFLID
jgi:glycosyltransferase involved in cell wall biosynthesis